MSFQNLTLDFFPTTNLRWLTKPAQPFLPTTSHFIRAPTQSLPYMESIIVLHGDSHNHFPRSLIKNPHLSDPLSSVRDRGTNHIPPNQMDLVFFSIPFHKKVRKYLIWLVTLAGKGKSERKSLRRLEKVHLIDVPLLTSKSFPNLPTFSQSSR